MERRHSMKSGNAYRIIFFLAVVFLLQACNLTLEAHQKLSSKEFSERLLKEKNPQLIDVRTPEEYSEGYISGARNINFYGSDFEQKIQSLDKTKAVYLYCRSGNRSGKAAALLLNAGFTQVFDLQGGIIQWTEENYLTIK